MAEHVERMTGNRFSERMFKLQAGRKKTWINEK
jgi:hypothetical protein